MSKNKTLKHQVQTELRKKGYSTAFDGRYYEELKKGTRNAFNQAHDIASRLIENHCPTQCDFQNYIF